MGPLEQATKEKAKTLGVDKNTLFMGVYDKPEELYQAMDIFVLPSLYEGLPVVAVEAQAAGLPCLLSDTITKQAALLNTEFLPLEDSASWADNIVKTLAGFKREDVSEQIAQAGFGIKSIIDKLKGFYGVASNEK